MMADASLLSYHVSSQVSGKIAQLGARLIDSAAQKLAGDFFGKLNELVGQTVPTTAQTAPPSPVLPSHNDLAKERAIGSSWRWLIAFALGTSALVVLIWFSS